MNFLVFLGYYMICTLFLLSIGFFVFKFIVKKNCHSVSKYVEKEIDNYFNAYDDNINDLLNDMNKEEGDENVNTTNW